MPGLVKIFRKASQSLVDAVILDRITAEVLTEYDRVWKPKLASSLSKDSLWNWAQAIHSSIRNNCEELHSLSGANA